MSSYSIYTKVKYLNLGIKNTLLFCLQQVVPGISQAKSPSVMSSNLNEMIGRDRTDGETCILDLVYITERIICTYLFGLLFMQVFTSLCVRIYQDHMYVLMWTLCLHLLHVHTYVNEMYIYSTWIITKVLNVKKNREDYMYVLYEL